MTADYDPLTLPAAYFEGLPTGVPNNLPSQPEPVEDMSAGADLTGVDSPDGGTLSCTFAPEVEAVTSPAPQPLYEGPDLTAEGPCIQQPEPYVRIWREPPSGKEVAMLLADDYRRVMHERDEFRAEVGRLKAALRIYADSGNWFYDQELEIMQWVGKDDGPYIAQQALNRTAVSRAG